jgi:hypothetical protein
MPTCFTPTNDGSLVGLGTDYPFGFSIDALMDFYWRRNWHTTYIQSDISASVVAGSSSDSISPINASFTGTYDPPVSTYHDLVCGSFIGLGYAPGDPTRLQIGLGLDGSRTIIYNGLYYPYSEFTMVVYMQAISPPESPPPAGIAEILFQWSSRWNQEFINAALGDPGIPNQIQKNINLLIDLPGVSRDGFQVLGYGLVTQEGAASASLSISEVTFSADSDWDYST